MSAHSPGRVCCSCSCARDCSCEYRHCVQKDLSEDFSGGYDIDDGLSEAFDAFVLEEEKELPKNITEISKDKFIVFENERLGGGAHGQVFRGLYENRYVAVKRISSRSFEKLQREVSVLSKFIDCPFIIDIIGVCKSTHELVLPLKENGSLRDYLQRQTLTFPQKKLIALEILNGLISLHLEGHVHGDISSANILIDSDGHACFCDFNLSKQTNESSTFGNLVYSAPENYNYTALYTTHSDVFSFGLVLFEIFFPPSPFVDRTFHLQKEKISREFWSNPTNSVGVVDLLSFPEVTGEEAVMKEIIMSCLQMNPDGRPSIHKIANGFVNSQWPLL
jgi:serine/threonine protein kinase